MKVRAEPRRAQHYQQASDGVRITQIKPRGSPEPGCTYAEQVVSCRLLAGIRMAGWHASMNFSQGLSGKYLVLRS